MSRMTSHPSTVLNGVARVPSDKSMSHRALMFGAIAEGTTRITGLLEAGDVMSTATALRAFGVSIEREGEAWVVRGSAWRDPERALDLGNAGTGVRLLMGLVSGRGHPARFVGDPSLMRRPMGRVLDPLAKMGLSFDSNDGRLPVTIAPSQLNGVDYTLPMASAQVKSAVLLAGLSASDTVRVFEPVPVRDHTERMLKAFGADITVEPHQGGNLITLNPGAKLKAPGLLAIPADPSSAAFPLVAASIVANSSVLLPEVMLNPLRTGIIKALRSMGASIVEKDRRTIGGEDVADLLVTASALRAVDVPPGDVPDMIDEIPVLAVAAAFAEGTSRFDGLHELTVKESDRLAATARLLRAAGVICRIGDDWLEIDGGAQPQGGGSVDTDHDHRIGMATLVMGLATKGPMHVTGADAIDTSFPTFRRLMNGLGAHIEIS